MPLFGSLMPIPIGQYVPLLHMERCVRISLSDKASIRKDGDWTIQRVEVSVDDFPLAQANFHLQFLFVHRTRQNWHERRNPALISTQNVRLADMVDSR